MIVAVIIAVILLIVLIVVLTIFAVKIENAKLAFNFTVDNTLQCSPNIRCPVNFDALDNDGDNTKIIKLIYTVEQYANTGTYSNEYVPAGFNKTKELFDSSDPKFPIGIIWEDTTDQGNKNIFIIFRGTQAAEFWKDLQYAQVPFMNHGKVHSGFYDIYTQVIKDIGNAQENINYYVAGHSLGAAIATLVSAKLFSDNASETSIYTSVLASPRVGDTEFCNYVNSNLSQFNNFINSYDIVPTLPPSVSPNLSDHSKPYIYDTCGTVQTFNINYKSIMNNHLLPVYIAGIRSISNN